MSSTAADALPALPPIRTTPPAPAPATCSSAASSAPAPEPAACSSAASSSTAPAPAPDAESVATLPSAEKQQQQQEDGQGEADSEAQDQETEPTTPTSEGSQLRPPAECPPPPRKPAWAPPSTPAKRKFPSSVAPSAHREFFPVTRDLTTVFRALPPKKRIRAG